MDTFYIWQTMKRLTYIHIKGSFINSTHGFRNKTFVFNHNKIPNRLCAWEQHNTTHIMHTLEQQTFECTRTTHTTPPPTLCTFEHETLKLWFNSSKNKKKDCEELTWLCRQHLKLVLELKQMLQRSEKPRSLNKWTKSIENSKVTPKKQEYWNFYN